MANGKRGNWSGIYAGDRPQDVLGLTQAQEAKLNNIIGFVGKDQNKEVKTFNVLVYKGSTAPTLTDFASTPIGTVIIAPELATPKIYIHHAKSATPATTDWFGITTVQES